MTPDDPPTDDAAFEDGVRREADRHVAPSQMSDRALATREPALDRLTVAQADRVRELEADRWRMGERIDALEAESSEVQAGWMEQVRTLEGELIAAKKEYSEQLQARLADATEARR